MVSTKLKLELEVVVRAGKGLSFLPSSEIITRMSKEITALKVYIVRHGETQENRDGIIQGQKDTELNEIGLRQASLLGEALRDVKFSFVFSSDLKRALNTAKEIMKHQDGIDIVIDAVLRERAMGYLEGRTLGDLEKISESGTNTIELASTFSKRLTTWWNRTILQSALSRSEDDAVANVLVVTHGGAIHTLVEELLESRKIKAAKGVVHHKCTNASITVIEVERRRRQGRLLAFGDVRHLGKMDVLEACPDIVCT